MSQLTEILLILGLVLLNGYFAAAEIALISVRRASLRQAADAGSSGARAALHLTEEPTRMLAAVQIGITLVGFLASATAAVTLSRPLAEWFDSLGVGWLSSIASGLALVVVTLVIAYATLVLGELAPKRLGLQRAETVARAVARPISLLATAVSPLVWFLSKSTDLVSRVLGVKPGQGRPGVTEEEIKLLVTEQGTLLEEEKRMIHEIFELGDTVAREVMVPRVDMVLVEDDETVGHAFDVMTRTGYSRLPVFHEDRDRIVGVALLKDLVHPITKDGRDAAIVDYARPPVFVPETKPILPLLSEMQRVRQYMVIVVDEHGGTAGLLTIEDIVEEIIGEVADEFDRDRQYITEVVPGDWILDGRLPIEDALSLGLPVEESDEYETIAGWVLEQLGHIPTPGERFDEAGYEFRVQAMRRRRIARLRVTRGSRRDDSATGGTGGQADGA